MIVVMTPGSIKELNSWAMNSIIFASFRDQTSHLLFMNQVILNSHVCHVQLFSEFEILIVCLQRERFFN